MTPTHPAEPPATAVAAPRTTAPRRALRAVAIAACLPYLALKTAWLTGFHIGIPEGSELLTTEGETALFLLNALTVAMDAAVVALALALTLPRGRRLPAWLMLLPLWIATGLLAPIVLGFPFSVLLGVLGGRDGNAGRESADFLDDWVFTLVYTGFGVQALALGALFALYVRDRWGPLLGGRLADLPDTPTAPARRTGAVAAAVLALVPAALHLTWAAGATAGLPPGQAGQRDAVFRLTEGMDALFAAAAAAGVLLLAFRTGAAGGVRLRTATALAWTGSAALTAGSGWMLLADLANEGHVTRAQETTAPMALAYAVEMVVGVLVLTVGAHLFAERSAERSAERAAGR